MSTNDNAGSPTAFNLLKKIEAELRRRGLDTHIVPADWPDSVVLSWGYQSFEAELTVDTLSGEAEFLSWHHGLVRYAKTYESMKELNRGWPLIVEATTPRSWNIWLLARALFQLLVRKDRISPPKHS